MLSAWLLVDGRVDRPERVDLIDLDEDLADVDDLLLLVLLLLLAVPLDLPVR